MRTLVCGLALALLVPRPLAQLADLQPGRNFPTAINAFGGDRSENIDVGDVDNDGDYDVVVANGGDGGARDNRLYVNLGGLQAGTTGTFSDESAARLAGVPADTSRDCEFADFEGDGDLDIHIANRGTQANGGEVSRSYTNQGGLQAGTIGFYAETTDSFWGTLVSVPMTDEVGAQDGQGPWKDYSCDCDFGDFDSDGDVDLFHGSYGPSIDGTRDSRVFLNDGDGVFDELWPWADAGADTRLHTLDVDLFDIDGDLDLDIFASSRDSQARVYRNNASDGVWLSDPFTDITQMALIDQGTLLTGSNNNEVEYADLDGDGDFDVHLTNYNGDTNRILTNDGSGRFTQMDGMLKGDPSEDEREGDFLDFDSDGDLDIVVANFFGANWLYTGGVAQGLSEYHRNGTTSGGSVASWEERPANAGFALSLDCESADMDDDGDPDVIIANDANAQNRYWENVRGVPDTHAPTPTAPTWSAPDPDEDTILRVSVADNAPHDLIEYYDVRVLYSVDGGDEVCLKMASQGGQLFRAVIPAIEGSVSFRIEATDDNGNTGVSAVTNYTQTSTFDREWQHLGCGTPGVYGVPYLTGYDSGADATIDLSDGAPSATAVIWLGVTQASVPFKGGTLFMNPIIVTLPVTTGSGGEVVFQVDLSAFPTGFPIIWQAAIQDSTALGNVAISNAVLFTAP